MKIAIDATLVSSPASGVETCIRDLVRALVRWGTADYALFGPPDLLAGPLPSGRRVTLVSPALPRGNRLARIAWQHLQLPRLLRRHAVPLLHAPGYTAPLAGRTPLVLTVYDTLALDHPEWCKTANWLHYRLTMPAAIRRAARLIVPSSAVRQAILARVPAAADRIEIIHPGLRDGLAPVTDEEALHAFRARRGLDSGYILFLGNLEPKKNLARLVRAYHELRRTGRTACRLVIAGRRGWKDDDVFATVRALGLQDEVVFTGFVSDQDLALFYGAADLFVFPSLYEGFGLPPLEAMACGSPVVTSDRGALPEAVAGAALTVNPLDIAGLADAMHRALSDAGLRARLRAAGLERARDFDWRRAAEATEAVYAQVLAPAKEAAP